MKGDKVIVRAYRETALIRRIWDINEYVIYIIDENNYQKLKSGQKALEPIGFPKEDVFKYKPELEKNLDKINWSKLEPWI